MLRHVQCTAFRSPWLLIVVAAFSLAACGGSSDDEGVMASPIDDLTSADGVELSKKNRVLICHKGKDKKVPESAVAGHMRHGDTMGSCAPAECPCFDLEDVGDAVDACPVDPIVLACTVPDPATLALSCPPGASEPGFVIGFYVSETGNGGSCERVDVNGSMMQDGLTAAEHQACVDVITASGYCN